MHMVLARGSGIPNFSGFFLDLVVIAHPLDEKETLWLITYNPPEPKFTNGSVEIAREPDIEPAVVRASLAKLAAVLPNMGDIASRCRWDVYAGWKTDAPGGNPQALLKLQYAKPYNVRGFGLKNFLAVWPNHWCLATPAAKEAAAIVRDRLKHNVVQPQRTPLPTFDPEAARMQWMRSDRCWQSWTEFAKKYDYTP